jgi:uncharacterized protein YcbX
VYLAEIWRYPVKSMGGERLREARVSAAGIDGDRVVRVENAAGRIVTARTHARLLGHRAVLGARGEPLVDGRPWSDPAIQAAVEADGAIDAFGYDGRRLRPNLIIGGVAGLDERTWEGRALRIGDVVIALDDLRGRCVMTTYDPDTLAQDPQVLKRIVSRFGGSLALNAAVARGGVLREGDRVELLAIEE